LPRENPSPSPIAGSATFRIEKSTASMNWATSSTARTSLVRESVVRGGRSGPGGEWGASVMAAWGRGVAVGAGVGASLAVPGPAVGREEGVVVDMAGFLRAI
jgi:hypothetical protein